MPRVVIEWDSKNVRELRYALPRRTMGFRTCSTGRWRSAFIPSSRLLACTLPQASARTRCGFCCCTGLPSCVMRLCLLGRVLPHCPPPHTPTPYAHPTRFLRLRVLVLCFGNGFRNWPNWTSELTKNRQVRRCSDGIAACLCCNASGWHEPEQAQ